MKQTSILDYDRNKNVGQEIRAGANGKKVSNKMASENNAEVGKLGRGKNCCNYAGIKNFVERQTRKR